MILIAVLMFLMLGLKFLGDDDSDDDGEEEDGGG